MNRLFAIFVVIIFFFIPIIISALDIGDEMKSDINVCIGVLHTS